MRKKILIVAKTYPTKSKKYTELVCTAGVDAEGNWYRIYPMPTKTLYYPKKPKQLFPTSSKALQKNKNNLTKARKLGV